MKPRPTHQRRQAHRRRLAYGRALHQILSIRRPWLRAWRNGERPPRIKIPYVLRHCKVRLYRAFMGA